MPIIFNLRRAFDHGAPIGAARHHEIVRGELTVREQRDDRFKRQVRSAEFRALDGALPVPPLRNVEILQWAGDCLVLTGVEELADDAVAKSRLFAQTWQMTPEAVDEVQQLEQKLGRLVLRLHQAGIEVRPLPGGGLRIAGETWLDGSPRQD